MPLHCPFPPLPGPSHPTTSILLPILLLALIPLLSPPNIPRTPRRMTRRPADEIIARVAVRLAVLVLARAAFVGCLGDNHRWRPRFP